MLTDLQIVPRLHRVGRDKTAIDKPQTAKRKKAPAMAGAVSQGLPDQRAYFSAVWTLVKVVFSREPRP